MFTQSALIAQDQRLQKFALRLTRNKDDASDLVQSTYLRALEKKDYFNEGTNLQHWSSRIMFNIFVSDYRRKVKFNDGGDPDIHIQKLAVEPMQEINVEISTIKRMMVRLSYEHRCVIVLVCFKGMTYKEAAYTLHVPVGTVRSRLFRALQQLNAIMGTAYSSRTKREEAINRNLIKIKDIQNIFKKDRNLHLNYNIEKSYQAIAA